MSFVDRLFPRTRPQAGAAPETPAVPTVPVTHPGPSTVYPPAASAPAPQMATEWQPAPYRQEAGAPAAAQAPAPGAGPIVPAPVPQAPAAPAPADPAGPPQSPASARPAPARQDVEARRQALSRQLAELQWDLGGLTYEMAIRDHFRLDVLARQAARLQAVDAELAEVERQLRLEDAGASGECPSCRALHSRGAVFCWSCGAQLLPTQPAGGAPPAPAASQLLHKTRRDAPHPVNVAYERTDAALCPDCHAELADDQAYCINCGLPVSTSREPAALLEAGAVPAGSEAVAAPAGRRLMILPGLEMSLGLAVAVFALVLGLGAWAGAASMQGGGPLRYALAGVTGQGSPSSQPEGDTGALDTGTGTDLGSDPLAGDTLDTGTLDAGVTDAGLAPVPVDQGTTGGGGGGTGGGGGGDEGRSSEEAATPQLSSVWLISLNDQSFEKLYDTAGAARASADGPYLATTLTKAGALVPDLFGVTRGSLAAQVALVSGQGPNPATREGCPSYSELSGGEPGKYDQAPGSGCGYPANYPTIADLLTGAQKRWKVYAGIGDRLDGGAPALCRLPTPGSRPLTGPLPFPLFASFTGDPECSSKVASTAALAEDTASKEKTPAFSFVLPGPCEDASDVPCQDGTSAGVAPANAFLRRTVEAIRGSAAYKAGGAIIITASQSAPGAENPDNSACCEDRPWYGKDVSSSGGGRVGALVLSPLVKGGTVIDGRFDHYDLLRTVADGLGVRRPGLASHPKVTGLPRETWSAWNGKKPAAAKPVE